MSIYSKIFEIMGEAETLEKSAHSDDGDFDFVPDHVVDEFIRKKLVEKRLLLIFSPSIVETSLSRSKVAVQYKFIDVDSGDAIDGTWAGEGYSQSGFGTAIAITSGIKQMIIKNFHIKSVDYEPARVADGVVPSIVDPEKIKEVVIPVPGEKRTRRSAKKGVSAIEHKISEADASNSVRKTIPTPTDDIVSDTPPEPVRVPEDDHAMEASPQNDELFVTTNTDGHPEQVAEEKPVDVTKMQLVSFEQMKAGLASNIVKEITKAEVITLDPGASVFYSFIEENGKQKIIYATTI